MPPLLSQREAGAHQHVRPAEVHAAGVAQYAVGHDEVADRCVQILGGMGISDETPVGMIFSDMRAFRLYDGPTEVHKYAIARQVLRDPS